MGAANCACGGPILSKMGVSIFRTPRSIFRIFVLFLVTKFLFLELLPTGPVSGFLGVREFSREFSETGPVGRSSKNRNFVTKNSTKILKIERGVLKIETPIFERIGPPQAQLADPITSGDMKNQIFAKNSNICY